jgi:hypothetical protein
MSAKNIPWINSAKTALPATKLVEVLSDGTKRYIDIDASSCATAMLVTVSKTPTGLASGYSDIGVVSASLGVQNIVDNLIGRPLQADDLGTFTVPVKGLSKIRVRG